jgi:hypothetical protein
MRALSTRNKAGASRLCIGVEADYDGQPGVS